MARFIAVLTAVIVAAAAAPARSNESTVAQPPVRADIQLRIDPDTRRLVGTGRWSIAAGVRVRMVLDDRFELTGLQVDGREQSASHLARSGLRVWQAPVEDRDRQVDIAWQGDLDPLEPGLDHRTVLVRDAPVADPRGSFLPAAAHWHPVFEGAGLDYRVAIDAPGSQRAIVPGRLLGEDRDGGRRLQTYAFSQPEPAIPLMAGPFVTTERPYTSVDGRRIALRALLHPEVASRGAGDLEAVGRYLRLYEDWIGPYPYDDFSIVSSPTPTGFGMPTLTYLGVDVLRLPFIRDTSLGHEVLHNWWGNGVRPAEEGGNWSEGLTTFMADYAYKERAGEADAMEMRAGWLRDFAALGAAADRPLASFTARAHGVDQVVGYHKSAMLFLMLRDAIGVGAFDRALQAFWREHAGRAASWDVLRAACERASGRDLRGTFGQWIDRAGAPDVRLESASAERAGGAWRVTARISQGAPAYDLRIPVALRFADGDEESRWVALDGEVVTVAIDTARRPQSVLLDPQARVFRRLAPGEAAPILRQAMLDPATATVLVGAEEAGAALARRMAEYPVRLHEPTAAPGTGPLLVIGLEAQVARYLSRHALPSRPPELEGTGDGASAWVWTAARRDGAPLTVVMARDASALADLARPLPHYGRQSWIVFDGATARARGVWPLNPQRRELAVR